MNYPDHYPKVDTQCPDCKAMLVLADLPIERFRRVESKTNTGGRSFETEWQCPKCGHWHAAFWREVLSNIKDRLDRLERI